jgi:hypothetical protein
LEVPLLVAVLRETTLLLKLIGPLPGDALLILKLPRVLRRALLLLLDELLLTRLGKPLLLELLRPLGLPLGPRCLLSLLALRLGPLALEPLLLALLL